MDKLYRAGATHVVNPNMSGASRMATMMLRPSVVSFLDVATRSSDLSLRIEQTTISAGSPVAGQTLAEAQISNRIGLIVIAVRKAGDPPEPFIFNPSAEVRLDLGDEVIVLGKPQQIEDLKSYLGD